MQWFDEKSFGQGDSILPSWFLRILELNKCVTRNIAYETYAQRAMLTLIPKWQLYSTKWMTKVVRCSATVWSGIWSVQESNNSAILIFFKRIICKMDKISPSFTVVYLDASNVNFELICVVVIEKSRRTHHINHPAHIQLSQLWIGNQVLQHNYWSHFFFW